jgi:hypothetical protein
MLAAGQGGDDAVEATCERFATHMGVNRSRVSHRASMSAPE